MWHIKKIPKESTASCAVTHNCVMVLCVIVLDPQSLLLWSHSLLSLASAAWHLARGTWIGWWKLMWHWEMMAVVKAMIFITFYLLHGR